MKLSGVAVGLCSLLLIACAADAPDTYAAKEADSTGLGSSSTTTTATSASSQKDPKSSVTAPTSVPDSSPTTTSEQPQDEALADGPIAPYRGTPFFFFLLVAPIFSF